MKNGIEKDKLIYLFLEPFIIGNGAYTHGMGIIEGLKDYYDVLLFVPNYNKDKKLPGSLKRFFYIFITQLKASLSLTRVKIIYIRWHFLSFPFFLWAYICGKKIILEINGPITDIFQHWKTSRLIQKLLEILFKIQLQKSDALLVVTPQLKEYFSKIYNINSSKIHVVPNAGNVLAVKPIKSGKHFLDKPSYVLYLGSLTRWQGLESLLEAPSFKDIWPEDLLLHIYGEGPLLHKVLQAAQHNSKIKYLGFINSLNKDVYYQDCTASIIPKNNLFDRCSTGLSPIKLYESLSYGVPVIVTDIPYMADIVKDHNLGIVVPYENSKELAIAINKIYKNAALRNKMSENAKNYIATNTWAHRANQVYQIISHLN